MAAGVFFFCGQLVLRHSVARVPENVIDLGEIVIFRREPENRHRIDAAAGGFLCAPDSGESLIERVSRPGKKAHLLAGDDGDSARREPVEVASSRGIYRVPGTKAAVLFAQN